ncbi:MAG: hypothetical protein IT440_06815 [Phycisphaeraceae bacterium]|nr:hypothetical protein [Phycisphaeraceae bacterium]
MGWSNHRYDVAVRQCLDNLLTHGTDRYGPVKSAMLMSVIDVRTHEAPEHPELLDGMLRGQERPGRCNPGGSDLWEDQPLLHALYHATTRSGDNRYARAADDYIRAFFQHAIKPNGMIGWGSHLFYNAYTEKVEDDRFGHFHEILILLAEWEAMWRVDPAVVQREIEGIWQWHIFNKTTGQHNRHDDGGPGCDFAFSSSSFIHAFAFLAKQTGDRAWTDRAKLVADWHWNHRHPRTNLFPDSPANAGNGRYDGFHCFTADVGPHISALLRSYELTGEPHFREVAVTYLKAWLKYAWDEKAGRFFAAVKLDGTPIPERAKAAGYDVWMPTGYSETWPSDMYSYDNTLPAAQACLDGYEVTKDAELLDGARKWGRHIRASFPPAIGFRWRQELEAAMPEAREKGGAYAEGYGRAIDFFVRLHRATSDRKDLDTAQALADEAVLKLCENGWIKGHTGKPYYQSTDGVGLLLGALLDLSEAVNAVKGD